MTALDICIVVAIVIAGIGGWRLGFLARALSWIGLGIGLYLVSLFLPRIVHAVNFTNPLSRLLLAVAALIGGALVGQALGLMLGGRLHRFLPWGPIRQVDRAVGAVVGVVGVLAMLWLLIPALAAAPGWPARETRSSAIARWVNSHAPRPPNTLESLGRLVGAENFPQVFNELKPGAKVGPPPANNPLPSNVTALASASTVKVEGQACNHIQDGSGWAVGTNLIVTNAHVVAGEPAGSTDVLLPSGKRLSATVVLFDSNRDLALLSVPGLSEAPLTLATASPGVKGAVLGHPNGQDALAVQPAVIAQEVTAVGQDLYNTHSTSRDVFVLASYLAPGDSGGPLMDTAGNVVGVAFAIAPDKPTTAYALSISELRPDLAEPHSNAVSTGACLND